MPKTAEEIFSSIYENNSWGSQESVSGPGSSLENTKNIRRELPYLISQYGVTSILDAPCGDMNWMAQVDLNGTRYIGMDIVPALIDLNRIKFPDKEFIIGDLTTDILPRTDLLICRDCLFHFPYEMIFAAFGDFLNSGCKFFLITNHTWNSIKNVDIKVGDYRRLNLRLPPFFLPPPLEIIVEGNREGIELGRGNYQPDRSICLWDWAQLRQALR